MNKINILLIKPSSLDSFGNLEMETIEDNYKEIQKIVEGYFETIPILGNYVLVVNEEGKLKNLEPSLLLMKGTLTLDIIFGRCFITKVKGEDFASLTEEDFDILFNHLYKSNLYDFYKFDTNEYEDEEFRFDRYEG